MKQLSFSFGVGLFVAGVAFACSSSDDKNSSSNTGAGQTPEQLFRAIQPDLVKNCGGVNGACHVDGTHKNAQGDNAARWLGPGDPYQVAKAYPGIIPITNEPRDSKLLTQVEHDGPALVTIDNGNLFEGVKKWVTAEVAASGTKHPVTEAFYVKDGTNSVSLAALAAGADGASLSFDAQNLDGTLFVSNMKVTAGAKSIAFANITVVILPATGPTRLDPLGGFQGQLVVKGGASAPIPNSDSVIPNWNVLNKLKIVFDQFAVTDATVAEAGATGCKDLNAFVANAIPAFRLDLGNGQTCAGCHGVIDAKPGSDDEVAVTTLDLRNLDSQPAVACANALTRVNLADKAKSDLILTPTGDPAGDPTHPVRTVCAAPDPDGGSTGSGLCVPSSYATSIMTWLNGE